MGGHGRSVATFYAMLSISFWGVSFVSAKALLTELNPYILISFRFGIATLFLLLLLIVTKQSFKMKLMYFQHIFILAVLGVFIHQVLQVSALKFIDASAAGWIISLSPIFTMILSVLFLSERFSFIKLIGMVTAGVGVLLVTTQDSGGNNLVFPFNIGYVLMVLSTLNWAVYSILIKKFRLPYTSLTIVFWTSFVGFLLTIPLLYQSKGWNQMVHLSNQGWLHLLFLGIFVSAIAYWYWGRALEHLEATQVSVMMYFEPLITLIAAILLLHEQIALMAVVGGFCIIVGVSAVNNHIFTAIQKLALKLLK